MQKFIGSKQEVRNSSTANGTVSIRQSIQSLGGMELTVTLLYNGSVGNAW